MREWIKGRIARRRQQRAAKESWGAAVNQFNAMIPQQRLVVFASLLKDDPDLRTLFRRALAMQDAPQQTEERGGSRILTASGRTWK